MPRKQRSEGRRKGKKKEKEDVRAEEAKADDQAKPNSRSNIPQDVVVEILSRLPLNSLCRFACVSKQWRSLISDLVAQKTGRKMVLVQSILDSGTLAFHSIDQECNVKRVRRPGKKKFPWSTNSQILGSCNGLLLLGIEDDLFLWNPVTRYFKKVLSYEILGDERYGLVSGLCYDSSTNEYKALMALSHERPDFGREFVVVASFKNKSWTSVRFPYAVHSMNEGPVLNGHLHWSVSEKYSDHFLSCDRIIYFNPVGNKFKKVPMPAPKNNNGDSVLGLGVLDGCLCMVRTENYWMDAPKSNIEVLVMKEYGVGESWAILFFISNLTSFWVYDQLVPLGYTKNGEALMEVPNNFRGCDIRAYNPIDGSHRIIPIQPHCSYVNATTYEESLVTPPAYDWEEDELRGEVTYVEYYRNTYLCKMRKRRGGRWEFLEREKNDYEQPNSEEPESDSDESDFEEH